MLKARTKLACRIAGIDPLRLNEAVHAGRYPIAPATKAGSSRVYEVDDIVALCIYKQLTDDEVGVSAENAGYFAGQALSKFEGQPDVEVVFRVTCANRSSFWTTELPQPTAVYGAGRPQIWMGFNIKALRDMVTKELEEEFHRLGEED